MTTTEPLRRGVAGVEQTIAKMTAEVRKLAKDEFFRERVLNIVRHARSADTASEWKAIWEYLTGLHSWPYRFDPVDVEHVTGGLKSLVAAGGDCDDYSVLAAAMFEAIGYPTEFVTAGTAGPPGEDRYHHVYLRVFDPRTKTWHAFDPVLNRPGRFVARPGMELVTQAKRRFPVSDQLGSWFSELERKASQAVKKVEHVAQYANPVFDAEELAKHVAGKNTWVGKTARAAEKYDPSAIAERATEKVLHLAQRHSAPVHPGDAGDVMDAYRKAFGFEPTPARLAAWTEYAKQHGWTGDRLEEGMRFDGGAHEQAYRPRAQIVHIVGEPRPTASGFKMPFHADFLKDLQKVQADPVLSKLLGAQLHEAAQAHAASLLHAAASGQARLPTPVARQSVALQLRETMHPVPEQPLYLLPVYDPQTGKWQSIGLSLRLEPPPSGLGFEGLGDLGNWFTSFVHKAIGVVNKIGYQIDPTRKDSPLRKAIGIIPVIGQNIVHAADTIADARKRVIELTGKDPAAILTTGIERAIDKAGNLLMPHHASGHTAPGDYNDVLDAYRKAFGFDPSPARLAAWTSYAREHGWTGDRLQEGMRADGGSREQAYRPGAGAMAPSEPGSAPTPANNGSPDIYGNLTPQPEPKKSHAGLIIGGIAAAGGAGVLAFALHKRKKNPGRRRRRRNRKSTQKAAR